MVETMTWPHCDTSKHMLVRLRKVPMYGTKPNSHVCRANIILSKFRINASTIRAVRVVLTLGSDGENIAKVSLAMS